MEFAKLPTILIWVKSLARKLVEKGTEQLSTYVKTGDLKKSCEFQARLVSENSINRR
jgi:hypothetical protein